MKNYLWTLATILAVAFISVGFANNLGTHANTVADTRVEVINADNKPVPVKGQVNVDYDVPFEVGRCYEMIGPANVSLGRNKVLEKRGYWVRVVEIGIGNCPATAAGVKWINTGLVSWSTPSN